MTSRADALLAGPRGRRLCLAVALGSADHGWPPLTCAAGPAGHPVGRFDPGDVRRSLAAAVAALDLDALAGTAGAHALLPALMESVDWARYWQEADDADQLLAAPALAELLAPVAGAVVRAPASQWWTTPLSGDDQHVVAWPDGNPPAFRPPLLTGASAALLRWRDSTLAEERQAVQERPTDPRAPWSGSWWSTPVLSRLTVTSRELPGGPTSSSGIRTQLSFPVGLVLGEDEMGWKSARTWRVQPVRDARVYELTGPEAWAALAERYPLEVTASRRHDWWRVTGWDGAWVIPDWSAVAAEFDAVHLTVDGYLSTAGRALPVDLPGLAAPARTLLGGWDPDATWWLTDVLPGLGEPTDWRRAEDELPRWEPVG